MPSIDGFTAAGFEGVAEAFERNFTDRGELGAAFAVTRDGELVIDLWGGIADRQTGAPWQRDTIQVVMSGTKAFVAVCLLILLERGDLDLDAPVARYWPEFAAAGKADVPVWHLAAHKCRMPTFHGPVTAEDLLDPDRLAARLAAQPQEDDPRIDVIYHGITYGWLCGELVRRVTGRTVGTFFAEEVAKPLDLDIWIGLPAGLEPRVATLEYADDWLRAHEEERRRLSDDPLWQKLVDNPPLFPPDRLLFNERPWRACEMGAVNGIASARSVARLYGCLARGGQLDGVRLLSPETIELGTKIHAAGEDPFGGGRAFGLGFMLPHDGPMYGPAEDAFGHPGAGGSLHGAWPHEQVGFSYAMNRMRRADPDNPTADPRAQALMEALRDALAPQKGAAGAPDAAQARG
jgi:CubicO group peptidase (beta-lactamase class C family)